jgi:uncharacterized protein YjbI with pentapeptide repeats
MRRIRPMLAVALAAAAIVLVWLLFDVLPDVLTPEPHQGFSIAEEQKARADVRTSFLTLLGGLTLVAGAIATWRSIRTAQDSNVIARAGQVTDRFTSAVEQLGEEKSPTVRVGGIYALEQIARDSPRDREAIKQLLGALIRERAPRADEAPQTLPADVQAALTVLGRREPAASNYIERPVDLRGVQLRGADLDNARLDGIDLRGADLSWANMTGVKQRPEQLREGLTVLSPVRLQGARLHHAYIPVGDLSDADLQEVDLTAAVLGGTNLQGANLRRANLKDCILQETDLSDADLSEALNLDTATLDGAKYNDSTKWPAGFTPSPASHG